MKYLRKFENEAAYNAYAQSEEWITPNVCLCKAEHKTKHNKYIPPETRVVAKYNVTSTSSVTKLQSGLTSNIASMEIDGVELQTPVSAYTFNTVGEHMVKFTLIDNTTIGQNAFNSCTSLFSITIPNSVTSIEYGAFGLCTSLSSITIPDSVTSIGIYVFRGCTSLSSVTIGSGVTSIGDSVFQNCTSLSSVTMGSGVTSIGSSAFASCTSLSSITIPDSVTSIGESAFSGCRSLSSVTIGSGVTSIGQNAFRSCTSLSSVTIGSGVTTIGEGAFKSCTSLSSITYNGTQSQWGSITKGSNWNQNVPATVVHCTDGDKSL